MKEKYIYKFMLALAPPDNQGVVETRYRLSEKEYNSVKKQILAKDDKIVFIEEKDGEPMCFTVAYPVIYVTTEKMPIPKTIILPGTGDKGKLILSTDGNIH